MMAPSVAVVKASDASAVSQVKPDQTLRASKALLAHIKKSAAESQAKPGKKSFLDDEAAAEDTPVWLTLTTKTHIHDSHRLKPGKIPLPHSLVTEDTTICLITADPQRAYKNMVASEEFPEELMKRITRVIDLQHLKAKFKSYEDQRKLGSEHSIFLADDRIVNRLPKVLGKSFFKNTAKRPLSVVFQAPRDKSAQPQSKKEKRDPQENVNARPVPEIVAEIQKAIGATYVHLSPSTNTAVKVGYASWTAEDLAENIDCVARELVEKFVPRKWNNVRSIFIKGPETAALPIFETDELWVDEDKIVPNGQEPPRLLPGKKQQKSQQQQNQLGEKANIGKKRKTLGDDAMPVEEEESAPRAADVEERPKKKAKKEKMKQLPESNDDRLDKEIAERKASLKKQKSKAKKALDL